MEVLVENERDALDRRAVFFERHRGDLQVAHRHIERDLAVEVLVRPRVEERVRPDLRPLVRIRLEPGDRLGHIQQQRPFAGHVIDKRRLREIVPRPELAGMLLEKLDDTLTDRERERVLRGERERRLFGVRERGWRPAVVREPRPAG